MPPDISHNLVTALQPPAFDCVIVYCFLPRHRWHKLLATHYRADSRLAPSQWEMSLHSNAISHLLGATLESALRYVWHRVLISQDVYSCVFIHTQWTGGLCLGLLQNNNAILPLQNHPVFPFCFCWCSSAVMSAIQRWFLHQLWTWNFVLHV